MANKNPWMKYIILLIIALILLGVNVLKNKKHVATSEKMFDIATEDITEFTIAKDTLSVTLIKGDTTWVFAAPDTGVVAQQKVDNFLNNVIKEGEVTDYQTQNPEKYDQYNISDDKATKLTITTKDGKKIELFASRSGSSWAHDYIRYADDPKVYMTSKKIIYHFSERAGFWR